MIKNLETGEVIPLSQAEQIIPKGTDPVSFHILKMTSQISHRYLYTYIRTNVIVLELNLKL